MLTVEDEGYLIRQLICLTRCSLKKLDVKHMMTTENAQDQNAHRFLVLEPWDLAGRDRLMRDTLLLGTIQLAPMGWLLDCSQPGWVE